MAPWPIWKAGKRVCNLRRRLGERRSTPSSFQPLWEVLSSISSLGTLYQFSNPRYLQPQIPVPLARTRVLESTQGRNLAPLLPPFQTNEIKIIMIIIIHHHDDDDGHLHHHWLPSKAIEHLTLLDLCVSSYQISGRRLRACLSQTSKLDQEPAGPPQRQQTRTSVMPSSIYLSIDKKSQRIYSSF